MTNNILQNFVNSHMIDKIPYICKPLLGQILYVIGMKKATTTFAAALTNVLSALAFIAASIFTIIKLHLLCLL